MKHAPSLPLHAALGRLALTVALTLGASAQARDLAHGLTTLSLADCAPRAAVLRPTQDAAKAQAVWVDRHQLFWPGADPGDHYTLRATDLDTDAKGGALAVATVPLQAVTDPSWTPAQAAQLAYLGAGVALRLPDMPDASLRRWLQGPLEVVRQGAGGEARARTRLQTAPVIDVLFASAQTTPELGARLDAQGTAVALWAPTAVDVALCVYPSAQAPANALWPLRLDEDSGVWSRRVAQRLDGRFYRYLVTVWAPGTGWVRNAVTDPTSVGLSANGERSAFLDLDGPGTQPAGWRRDRSPATVPAPTDAVIYELHVRDFSLSDPRVRPEWRGKYLAFTQPRSLGMQHLRRLARAGLTDVHLLPVYDFATVPETGCVQPRVAGGPSALAQAAAVQATAARDCFAWGYDPVHYSAPEGSYATRPDDPAARVREFRAMVQSLHRAGLRVGMDVVYNHTHASGQMPYSVLDRIVPGYYHRLNRDGDVERSTCCENTAAELAMMARLLSDSVSSWVRHFGVDAFRFDLMGHLPRATMVALRQRLAHEAGRPILLIGEGWDFGEVAHGARFVQASQLSLAGTGIGTFNDRLRDAVRGGSATLDLPRAWGTQGFVSRFRGPVVGAERESLPQPELNDAVRAGLAGSLRDVRMVLGPGQAQRLGDLAYGDQPRAYAAQPEEVVNYVENHDNRTLFDELVLKLPPDTPATERVRAQSLALMLTLFSQGIPYFHAGGELLRSKSMDGNSFDSGDWFNRIDWSGQRHGFGVGMPPDARDPVSQALLRPLLEDARLRMGPAQMTLMRRLFEDGLRIRRSSALLRLRDAAEVQARLSFLPTDPQQAVVAGWLRGAGLAGAGFDDLIYVVNAENREVSFTDARLQGMALRLHPVQALPEAADPRLPTQARFDSATGRWVVPPLSAVVFVGGVRG